MKLSNYPVLKALIPLLFGIILGYFLPIYNINVLYTTIAILSIWLILIVIRRKNNYFLQRLTSVLLILCFVVAGYHSVYVRLHQQFDDEKVEKLTAKQSWFAELIEPPQEKERSVKIVARLTSIDSKTENCTKKVILYFQKDSAAMALKVGTQLLVTAKLGFVEPPKNPYQFNYQEFLQRKGIWLTSYVPKHSWQIINQKNGFSFKKYAGQVQQYLSLKLSESGLSGSEFAVAAAVLLGNDDTMEPELRASYAAAGVSHILCVSGMHVGILFMVVNFLLMPLEFSRRTRLLKSIILLLIIWSYANITGLSPSVSRAAAMFTFVLIGNMLRSNTNIIHSLFASLFILLVYNPLFLFEVGFQLSYLAVFGIVIFQEKIVSIYKTKTKLGNYFWNLIAVSIAAQLATFPIAIYYFGQFPNYFLFANLSVISLSFAMVITGIITLATSFSSILSHFIGIFLQYEIKIMNFTIEKIENLPGAVTSNISINPFQVMLIYVMIFSIYQYLTHKKKASFFALLMAANIFLGFYSYDKYQSKNKFHTVEYQINKSNSVQFYENGEGVIFSDSITSKNHKSYHYNIQNHDRKMRINNIFINIYEDFENNFLCKQGNLICFRGEIYYLSWDKQRKKSSLLIINDKDFPDWSSEDLERIRVVQ